MEKTEAIKLAGNATALAKLLGISPSAISHWGEFVPDKNVWKLRVLRPKWFKQK